MEHSWSQPERLVQSRIRNGRLQHRYATQVFFLTQIKVYLTEGIPFPALGSVYQFVFEAQLQLDLYNQAVEGDLAIDDVVLHPGCV